MKRFVLFASFAIACLTAGCHSAPAKHYPLQAEVISVDASRGLIVVKHGEIPGLMPAMTMQYSVADPKQIEKLQPGDKITAVLVVNDSKGQLEKIILVSKGDRKSSPGTSQHIPDKDEAAPDFAFVNRNG
jgi:Cu/Ag efflux protein CusF